MGFWSGFEGLTGHRPGAFKGFSLKDIIDKDLWERRERKFPSPRYAEEGLDAPTTAWYRGRGRPEMMGPRVGAAGVPSGVTPVNPAAIARRRAGGYAGPPVMEQVTSRNRLDRTMPRTQNVPGVAHTSAARPWANIQAQMLRDPRQGVSGMRIPPAELMGEKTTVKKIFADPTKSDTVTETIKEKVPMGGMRIPTSELMGGGQRVATHSGYFPPPPNWLERVAHAEGPINPGYFGRPASIMNMRIPTSELAGGRDEDRIREMFRVLQGMKARRGY